jgi:DNA topoisomerase I
MPTQLEQLLAHGIRRIGAPGRGFTYRQANGKPVPRAQVARIQALKIPPAWKNVRVSPSPRARLQAVGQDRAGRWQYRYHPAFVRRQEDRKYRRLLSFAGALPALRRRVTLDLRRPGLPREKVLACVLRILSTCFVRPGSAAYASENGSYGLATLRRQHVQVKGDLLVLDFPGKSKQRQHREMRDRTVARIVRELLKLPGREVFKYMDRGGAVVDVRRRHINQYIKEVMGEHFSAKDFRTWAGTLICACALARAGVAPDDAPKLRKKKLVEAVKETAQHLGNTPAICRASYIYPPVLSSFERGLVVERAFKNLEELARHHGPGYHASERALLKLLKAPSRQAA